MNFFILVTSSSCAPCHQELQDAETHQKQNSMNLDVNRFLIIDMLDEGHLPWIELLQPEVTPSFYTIKTEPVLHTYNVCTGLGCIDAGLAVNGLPTPWLLVNEADKTAVENDPDSQEVAE